MSLLLTTSTVHLPNLISDLGLILEDDVVICISKSGNTPERYKSA